MNSRQKIDIKSIDPLSTQSIKPHRIPYVRAVQGHYQRLRRLIATFLIGIFIVLPWLTYQGNQAILFDINHQQFHFFSSTFWPQDLTLLATLFIFAAFSLCFLTTYLGRVWCGYLCPQTVWSFIYIWCEEKIEGPANKRKRQDSLPLTTSVVLKKISKHSLWLIIAIITSLTLNGYFTPIKQLITDTFTINNSTTTNCFLLLFTFITYINAGWLRTIVCTHMCPYARFQSVMLDNDSYIVAYHHQRGEPRGPRTKKTPMNIQKIGDCINCNLCVHVCPAGIDIRHGLQYECIHCGACVDICNHTMAKMHYSQNLISYTSAHQLLGQKPPLFRPKLISYGAISLLMVGVFIVLLQTLKPITLDVIRDRNQLFKINHQGLIENTYILKIANKSTSATTVYLSATGIENIYWYGAKTTIVNAGEVRSLPITLALNPQILPKPIIDIQFNLKNITTNNVAPIHVESRFIGR